MSIANYLKCAFTEPGFLPRSLPDETINSEKENNIVTDSEGLYYPLPRTKCIEIKDCYYEVKFCVKIRYNKIYNKNDVTYILALT